MCGRKEVFRDSSRGLFFCLRPEYGRHKHLIALAWQRRIEPLMTLTILIVLPSVYSALYSHFSCCSRKSHAQPRRACCRGSACCSGFVLCAIVGCCASLTVLTDANSIQSCDNLLLCFLSRISHACASSSSLLSARATTSDLTT